MFLIECLEKRPQTILFLCAKILFCHLQETLALSFVVLVIASDVDISRIHASQSLNLIFASEEQCLFASQIMFEMFLQDPLQILINLILPQTFESIRRESTSPLFVANEGGVGRDKCLRD